jgi:hypothetical protein
LRNAGEERRGSGFLKENSCVGVRNERIMRRKCRGGGRGVMPFTA